MAERHVTRSCKDADGDITALCCPADFWSPRTKAGTIHDMETGIHKHYVTGTRGRVFAHFVTAPTAKYLRTSPNPLSRNNLDDLPD